MLIRLDQVCKENGLSYRLCAGTLLGAVRHQGFIPWDDDVDVFMPRPDFECLLDYAVRQPGDAFGSRYQVVCMENGFMRPFARLLDLHTRIEQSYSHEASTAGSLWIDIFPVDGVPSELVECRRHYLKAKLLKALIGSYYSKPWRGKTRSKALLKTLVIHPLARMRGIEALLRDATRHARKFDFELSSCVGSVAWCTYGKRECLTRSQFESAVNVPFEGGEFPTFACWHDYLRAVYGNYEKLPEISKRRPTHTEAVWLVKEG